MRYRKKPVEIEAIQYTGENGKVIEKWSIGAVHEDITTSSVIISTLEGVMVGRVGCYIIKGIKGEFYPCEPLIFDATYEKII